MCEVGKAARGEGRPCPLCWSVKVTNGRAAQMWQVAKHDVECASCCCTPSKCKPMLAEIENAKMSMVNSSKNIATFHRQFAMVIQIDSCGWFAIEKNYMRETKGKQINTTILIGLLLYPFRRYLRSHKVYIYFESAPGNSI